MTAKKNRRLILSLLVCAVLCAGPRSWAVEHPGSVDKDCSSCHLNKITGKSVHSAMASPCTVCHVTMTQGDMTRITLSMPKTKICSGCHEESAALRQHGSAVKGQCVDCHDAHSSNRRMLLRAVRETVSGKIK